MNNVQYLIIACDVAISYYLQQPGIDVKIVTNNGAFFHCNHNGYPDRINQVNIPDIITCHNMTADDFQNFTEILNNNNYFIDDKKICIHKYLTKCSSNPQPPGFADFLRGTIALYNFSKKYDYNLLVDGKHLLFNFLKPNKNIIKSNQNIITEEFICPQSYEDIYLKLDNRFQSGESLSIMTNSFYSFSGEKIVNFGEITEDCRLYIKDILSPTIQVEDMIKYVFNEVYKIDMNQDFKVIHIRFGDEFIRKNIYDSHLYKCYYDKITNLVNNNGSEKYVLITDSSVIANQLKANIPQLLYWDNSKIHLGELINMQNSSILETIVDFFIMSRSKEIISDSGSGFSLVNSIIYNIKYTTTF
jgi:hypothetical protein